MKKIPWTGIIVIAILILLTVGTPRGCGNLLSMEITTTRCIRTRNGGLIVLLERGYGEPTPATVHNQTGRENAFEDLQTGDLVSIRHDAPRETYPLQITGYSCRLIERGSEEDIPADILIALTEFGYLGETVTTEYHEIVNGKNINISAEMPDYWRCGISNSLRISNPSYVDTNPHRDDFGMYLQATEDLAVELTVFYYPDGFHVGGVKVVTEELTLDSGLRVTYYTEEHDDGGVTGHVIFHDLEGTFVAQYYLNNNQREQYEEAIIKMIHSVQINVQ